MIGNARFVISIHGRLARLAFPLAYMVNIWMHGHENICTYVNSIYFYMFYDVMLLCPYVCAMSKSVSVLLSS